MKTHEKVGVSISKGDEFVKRIKSLVKTTFTNENLIGNKVLAYWSFGSIF